LPGPVHSKSGIVTFLETHFTLHSAGGFVEKPSFLRERHDLLRAGGLVLEVAGLGLPPELLAIDDEREAVTLRASDQANAKK
jgi:hypothetical protein